ncbi:hypothetical protein M666_10410 [Cellulophaga baltica 18]|uniref:Uncharacterized protein n=1 Tax=Cellulophaga baltica 18 TaxID=1348584 RepID=A0AAU8RP60_9FLAO|nr:hypothetical protein M667_10410 [Cellulophaga baltica NN016038]AIZ41956.1 hypothetical protein M666_10410 [Cellulophaga baltica 18]
MLLAGLLDNTLDTLLVLYNNIAKRLTNIISKPLILYPIFLCYNTIGLFNIQKWAFGNYYFKKLSLCRIFEVPNLTKQTAIKKLLSKYKLD